MNGEAPGTETIRPRRDVWIALSGPASAAIAGLIGVASAWADGVSIGTLLAVASVVLGMGAYSGFIRMSTHAAERFSGNAIANILFTIALPSLFLLVLAGGADYAQRNAFAWTPLAAGLSFALLTACLPLAEQFARREADVAHGRVSLAVLMTPSDAKLACLGIAFPAYIWLVIQVGRDALPQGCAAALITLLMSFHAARILHEHATDGGSLVGALRMLAIAAPLHGGIIAAALLLDTR